MSKLVGIVHGLLMLPLLAGSGVHAGELKAVVGSWCPYECSIEEAGGLRGFVTDIAVAVLSRNGFQVSLVSASYRRGIELVRENEAPVLVGIPREDAPDLVYPSIEQAMAGNAFYVRSGNPWRYRGLQALEQLGRIGMLAGVDYSELDAAIRANPQRFELVEGIHNARRNIEKLLAGRLDAIVEDPTVTEYTLHQLGKVGSLEAAGSLAFAQPWYIAFSPKLPDAAHYAELMTRGTQALRASGELAAILKRYGLRDWKGTATP